MQTEAGTKPETDGQFAGPVPLVYEKLLVPMLFRSYARDLATRVLAHEPARLLELAAGTGVLTRELCERLPETTSIVATDLNPPMLAEATRNGTKRAVHWQQADAMQLPFDEAAFDLVVCQFGVMFFPDKSHAYAEVRRVLQPGGVFSFNTWTRIEENEFANVVQQTLIELYPGDPPRFMARTPHGYFEPELIRRDLARAGFAMDAVITPLGTRCKGASARLVARAFCEGTPLRPELEARGPSELSRVTDAAEAALAQRFGSGEIEGAIHALVVEVGT